MLNPGQTRTIPDHEVELIVRRCQVLGSGLSGRIGVKVQAGGFWAADTQKKVLIYDLGTAAILDDEQRTGVIAHEAGHLRFTEKYDQEALPANAKKHLGRFHTLANALEDRRMELLMAEEFPGLGYNFDRLAGAFDIPQLVEGLKKASPAQQFTMGCYRVAYGREPVITYPEVAAAVENAKQAVEHVLEARNTQELASRLLEPGGLWDTLYDFITDPPEEPDGSGEGEGEGEAGQGEPGEGGSPGQGPPEDAEDGSEGDGDGSGEDGDGDKSGGDTDAAGDGEGEGEDGPIEYIDGTGVTATDTGGGGSSTGGQVIVDAEDVIAPEIEKPDPITSEPDDSALAALTENQRQLLDSLLEEMRQQPEVRGVADQIEQRLNAIAEAIEEAGKAIQTVRTQARHTPDDDKNHSPDDDAGYLTTVAQLGGQPSTLARNLAGVLRENSFDRWSINGYKSGRKLHSRKLHLAAQGNLSVYRRKESPKNRKYAVALLMDVSGSMMGMRMTMARQATILCGEALEKAGIDFSVYGFGEDTVCVKPFDLPLHERKGKIGSIHHLSSAYGNHTCMGWAVKRASEEMLSRYGDDWQKMLIVVTDGMPNACGRPGHYENADPRRLIRELEDDHGVECVGIGIAEDGVASIFPKAHIVIHDVTELPRTLVQAIRTRVRKG
jgi:hypothetical protein